MSDAIQELKGPAAPSSPSSVQQQVCSVLGSVEASALCLFRSLDSLRDALRDADDADGELEHFRTEVSRALKESQQELDCLLVKLRGLVNDSMNIKKCF